MCRGACENAEEILAAADLHFALTLGPLPDLEQQRQRGLESSAPICSGPLALEGLVQLLQAVEVRPRRRRYRRRHP